MNSIIKIVLNKIDAAKFEAYLVGGFVRDYILHNTSFDIDIATSASIEDLKKIFFNLKYKIKYRSFTFTVDGYYIEITPYRREGPYLKGRFPSFVESVPTIKEDSLRRDFTMNSLYMAGDSQIYCFNSGLKDIKDKVIRMIGNPLKRLEEDPLRILRALRFSVTLDFKIEAKLSKAILEHKELLESLSCTRKKEELSRMLNVSTGKTLDILDHYELYSILEIPETIVKTKDPYGFWVQMSYKEYPFTKEEYKKIYAMENLLDSDLTNLDLFYASEGELETVCDIKGFSYDDYKARKKVLPLTHISKLELDIEYLKKNHYPITFIKEDILNKVLEGTLQNQKDKIRQYITKNYDN